MAITKTHTNTQNQETTKCYIAYYRVSTQKQGRSGLGLESQQLIVDNFIGNSGKLVAEYTEVESGKNNSRVELQKAIDHTKEIGGTLIIAKLDRLSRNAGFIFTLKDSGVDFVCCDIPEANTLTIGIFATLAQHERELISERTKKALSALKARGKKLGTPENLTNESRAKASKARQAKARDNENNRRATSLALNMKSNGQSLRAIANELNANGFKTSTGKVFQANTVKRLLDRATA